jgi:hypothetical protein
VWQGRRTTTPEPSQSHLQAAATGLLGNLRDVTAATASGLLSPALLDIVNQITKVGCPICKLFTQRVCVRHLHAPSGCSRLTDSATKYCQIESGVLRVTHSSGCTASCKRISTQSAMTAKSTSITCRRPQSRQMVPVLGPVVHMAHDTHEKAASPDAQTPAQQDAPTMSGTAPIPPGLTEMLKFRVNQHLIVLPAAQLHARPAADSNRCIPWLTICRSQSPSELARPACTSSRCGCTRSSTAVP